MNDLTRIHHSVRSLFFSARARARAVFLPDFFQHKRNKPYSIKNTEYSRRQYSVFIPHTRCKRHNIHTYRTLAPRRVYVVSRKICETFHHCVDNFSQILHTIMIDAVPEYIEKYPLYLMRNH